jgi:hypothetical protein
VRVLSLSQRNLNCVVDGIMKLHEMIMYGAVFVASIAGFLWLLIAVFCALLGGGE